MKERAIIVFIAVLAGLILTTLGFLLYESTKKKIPQDVQKERIITATPSSKPLSFFVKIESPQNESLTEKRSVIVKGTTNPNNTLIVSTNQDVVAATPAADGSFSVTVAIDTGSNNIVVRAINPEGEETQDTTLVTFNSEEF